VREIEVPATLKGLLSARLDQLGTAKKLAQIGALVGRHFRYDTVLALCGLTELECERGLSALVRAGVVSRHGMAPDIMFTFRHALVQDAAYDSLLKSERQPLHRRVAELIIARFAETAEAEPELVARHFALGNVADQAVLYWLKAGQRAWQRAAAKEAIAHLTSGLELVGRIDDAAQRDALELRLQAALGVVYFATVSYAAPQAQSAFLRAHELTERVRQPELLAPVLYGIGAFETMKGEVRAGHAAFLKLMSLAQTAGDSRLLVYAHAVLAWSSYNRAEYRQAIAHAERVRQFYAEGPPAGPRLSAAHPMVISECFRALALWSLGFADQARDASDALLAHARQLHDPYSLAYALNFAALIIPDWRGDYALAVQRADEGIALAREIGYPFLQLAGMLYRVAPASNLIDAGQLLDQSREGLARCKALGILYQYPLLLVRHARLLLKLGDVTGAQHATGEALLLIEHSGDASIEIDARLADGEAWQASGFAQWARAQHAFERALATARQLQANGWVLRAALALCTLWAQQGERARAGRLLAESYGALTEGHDTADLTRARGLLHELNG
jgi:hypothetical protein